MQRTGSQNINLSELFHDNEEIHAVLMEVYTLFAKGKQDESFAYLKDKLEALGLVVAKLGEGGNNKNFVITKPGDGDERLVIQICRKSPEANSGSLALDAAINKPFWQPQEYDTVKGHPQDGSGSQDMIVVTVMEFLPNSLHHMVRSLADDAENDYAARFDAIANVSSQISKILLYLTQKGVIWTDMKPGNLPMRADTTIVMADKKGVMKPDEIPKRSKGAYAGSILYGDLTEPYLSEDFLSNKQLATKSIMEVRETWEREYSYQLAVILHHLATTQGPRLSERDGHTAFDFTHPVFSTDQGRRLKDVIDRLGQHNPLQRIRHADALKCINCLGDQVAFDKQMAIAEKNVIKAGNLMTSVSPPARHKHEDVRAAMAKLNAANKDWQEKKNEEKASNTSPKLGAVSSLFRKTSSDLLSKKSKKRSVEEGTSAPSKTESTDKPVEKKWVKATPTPNTNKDDERSEKTTEWVRPVNPYGNKK